LSNKQRQEHLEGDTAQKEKKKTKTKRREDGRL